MSRSETLMLLILGFALGLLLALLFGRLMWHMAVRVGSRRMQRQMPSTLAELRAERDRLRAECAMLSRKLEVRSEDLKAQLVERTAELVRERNHAESLLEEVQKRDSVLQDHDQRAGASQEQTQHLETELASRTAALQEIQARSQEFQDSATRMKQELAQLTNALADRDARISDLRRELAQRLRSNEVALHQEQVNAADRLKHRIEELTALSREISDQRDSFNRERSEFAALAAATVELPPDVVNTPYDSPDWPSTLNEVANHERLIERKLAVAERETRELAAEIERLDTLQAQPEDDIDAPLRLPEIGELRAVRDTVTSPVAPLRAPSAKPQSQRGLANVVSLAARIRALQKNFTG